MDSTSALDDARTVGAEWEDLRLADESPRYQDRLDALALRASATPGAHLDRVLVRRDGRAVGALPVIRYTYRHRWNLRLPHRTVHPVSISLTRATVPAENVLGAPDRAGVVDALDTLLASNVDADVVHFPAVRVGSLLDQVLASLPADAPGRRWCAAGRVERRLLISMPDDFDELLRSRFSGKSRFNMRREARQLLAGTARVTVATAEHEVEPFLEGAARVWSVSWHGRSAAPIDAHGRLADELRWAAGQGLFMGFSVLDGDETIAFVLAHLADGTLWVDKMAFDESRRASGPGSVLFGHALRRAHDLGARRVDLGYGDYPYKRRWSNASLETRPFELVRRSLRPLVAIAPPFAYSRFRTTAISAVTAAGLDQRARRISSRALGR